MAKQVIIAAMEEVFGEYILNISRDNLKIAALRGKITLENVQLDGELIGSHVMGAFGLTGFGVLSCSAKSIHVNVPWKNLEREPTKFEVRGVHLVCVPLTPSTAHKLYGAGTRIDPRCSLRTRAKRLLLARLERNFWNGQIPGEGPPMKRITRAVREVERDLRRSRALRRKQQQASSSIRSSAGSATSQEDAEMEEAFDNIVFGLNDSVTGSPHVTSDGEERTNVDADGKFSPDDLPEIPRDWKAKLREKILRNMEASIHEIHIRLEVPEGGLDYLSRLVGDNEHLASDKLKIFLSRDDKAIDERAFAVGFTLDSFVMRTANEQWEVGSHDKRNALDGSAMSSVKGQLGPNPYVVKNNKIGFFRGFSIYWDNEPPLLLAETDVLQGNYRKLSPDKLMSRVAGAMDALYTVQDPGKTVRQSLGLLVHGEASADIQPHDYVCHSLDAEVRARQSDRQCPGPLSCSADVLPFDFTFNIRPHQYLQYQRLQKAIKCQQHFDTMFRQRPSVKPRENPRAWWKYAIGCVMSRPNSRPWDEVLVIVQSRRRYIELVAKKNKKPLEGNGFHGSLSDIESQELLELEDLLPMEALETFHLLALRGAYDAQQSGDVLNDGIRATGIAGAGGDALTPNRRPRGRTNPFRILGGGGRERRRRAPYNDLPSDMTMNPPEVRPPALSPRPQESGMVNLPQQNSLSLLEAMTLRLGKKVYFILWKLHDATVNLVFLGTKGKIPLAHASLRSSGTIRSFGKAKRDFSFDVCQFDMFHRDDRVMFLRSPENESLSEDDESGSDTSVDGDATVASTLSIEDSVIGAPDLVTSSRFLPLPPRGIVCRLAAGKDLGKLTFSLSAHPATLVWTTALFDSFSEFMSVRTAEEQDDLALVIQNAATPLARKAQLALLSPASVSLHLNVSAPKIWVPISSQDSAGSLFLDAGTVKIASVKEEGETDMQWDIQSRDIRVNFIRGRSLKFPNDDVFLSRMIETTHRAETSIIRPVHLSIEARNRVVYDSDGFFLQDGEPAVSGLARGVDIVMSPISLNLVDAEVLARVFGKWYGRIVTRVRRRSLASSVADHKMRDSQSRKIGRKPHFEHNFIPRVLTLNISSLEVALEGHSKSFTGATDDRSLASQDSYHEVAPAKRTYIIDVDGIAIRQCMRGQVKRTFLFVMDASIARLRDGSVYSPLKGQREVSDAQYAILSRASDIHDDSSQPNEILRVSLMHNGSEHLDEVEIDIDSVILRVTPTTLKDCAKAFRRVAEFAQLVTREMERKVHEEGRKARRLDRQVTNPGSIHQESPNNSERPSSPATSEAMTENDGSLRPKTFASDSSILFKVTIHDSTLLAGRPTTAIEKSPFQKGRGVSFAVVQVLSNTLIMFQSIENPDASGTKTLHVSIDNVSSLVNTEFSRVSPDVAQPMVGPTGAELRVVYATENFGCVVSQDISFDCDALKACMTPNDLSIFLNVCKKMSERLRAFGWGDSVSLPRREMSSGRFRPLSSIIRYQKKGTGIATRIRGEVQTFSFVLLRTYKSYLGAPEFLDFNIQHLKGRLQGCISALSGDFSATLSVNFFNAKVADWEYVVEPFPVALTMDQMPNELVLNLASDRYIYVNLTGILLKDFAEMKFDLLLDRRPRSGEELNERAFLSPNALSTVGLRRATETRSIKVHNRTGFDIHVADSEVQIDDNVFLVPNGGVKTVGEGQEVESAFLTVQLAQQAVQLVGEREPVTDIPIKSASGRVVTYLLRPVATYESLNPGMANLLRLFEGRASPETILTDTTNMELLAYHNAEPVVEWCMHNERLRSSTVDVYSLEKGRDLLSNNVWSPEDENDNDTLAHALANSPSADDSPEAVAGDAKLSISSPGTLRKSQGGPRKKNSNWLKPYLKDDSPEWTDMTCTLRMARERVMLPDSNWIWINDWSVDLSGALGEATDADGWEYEADFETFTRTRRDYKRGDSCRRRRWTRTRIVKPPRLDDTLRQLKFVWESSRDDNGNYSVLVRSHVRVTNNAGSPLSFFVYSPSWDEDIFIGSANPGQDICVPVHLASAVYMRLAKRVGKSDSPKVRDCLTSERFVILPSSHTSSSYTRISMDLQDVSSTTLHFLVEVKSNHGVVDINVDPVLRVLNLLPCVLECQLGEVLLSGDNRAADGRPILGQRSSKRIAQCESVIVASGKNGTCTAISPWRKPHLSLRVPGYHWSPWQRIINRKANSDSWRLPDAEEDWHFHCKGDTDVAEEWKSVVRFKRAGQGGDPLSVILSVECGHCPTLRVYSQYWIVDKTGFGCHFSEGFTDFIGSTPDSETSRKSYLPSSEAKEHDIKRDLSLPGHQWSIGMSGMSLFFSSREKITLAIESGVRDRRSNRISQKIRSHWTSPLDISNVFPKTVVSIDELNGPRRFELAICVTVCHGVFSRTKMITLLPRYQIVNLLHRELVIAQDGCLDAVTQIPSQSAVSFHWERSAFAPKVRIGAPSLKEKGSGVYSNWTNGRIRVDRVGITSIRLPTDTGDSKIPLVVQAEVRLAAKDQTSAVVIVVWAANQNSNPLYILRNRTPYTIICRQPLTNEAELPPPDITKSGILSLPQCSGQGEASGCNTSDIGPIVSSLLGLNTVEAYIWVLKSNDVACFGFDDPEKPHVIEWTWGVKGESKFNDRNIKAYLEVDAMGSSSVLSLSDHRRICCHIGAEHSSKVIEFTLFEPSRPRMVWDPLVSSRIQGSPSSTLETSDDDEDPAFSVRIDVPGVSFSVVDNVDPASYGREILLFSLEKLSGSFSQTREGYHEFEFKLMSLQVDNHVNKSIHPVLIFCPRLNGSEPLLHMSAVRRLQQHSNTFVFRYAAIRVLEIDIFLDRRTAECVARFIEPLIDSKEEDTDADHPDWVSHLTASMGRKFTKPDREEPREIEKLIHTANSGRIYFEQLHLHPVKLGLTFTQEWMEWNPGAESMMVFQFIRGMASIANAPLVFTSFMVGHVFEAPQALIRVVLTHYSSQLTKQIFGILGSLAILGAPADFISNVGTGVRDFFYEPIQGAVHGPRKFIEGLEAGTESLARGLFVGVVRGTANVTDVVNTNLAGLTTDDDFIDERKAHQRMLTDAMSRGAMNRTFSESLALAGASIARGIKSGALGVFEQPTIYASKHGPVGFVKGVGKAIVGVVVKPVVGLGDAAVLVMNHMSDATSKKQILPRIPKRLRRALPCRSTEKPNCVRLEPYDERAAKAQKIVTGGESVDDVYLGHINIPSHLIIASEQCLWAIDKRSRDPWCVSWEEISHFGILEGGVPVVVFSQTGLKTFTFDVDTEEEGIRLHELLAMQKNKMGNSSDLNSAVLNTEPESLSRHQIPGIKAPQVNHVFGNCNLTRKRIGSNVKDEIDLVEQCFARVRAMGSDSSTFLKTLDQEAWSLVSAWGQVFSGLSSRRCVVAAVINGTGSFIQIKSTKLVEGGSPCYSIPTKEFDQEQGILHPGGVIIFFGWGVVPSLLQAGRVFMHLETSAFIADLADRKSRETYAEAMPGSQIGFLEKSYDDSGWWAKYCLLVRARK